MQIKWFKIALLLTVVQISSGQQLPTFTQYREYYGIINPASVYVDYMRGVNDSKGADATFFGLSSRYQWHQSPNPPATTILHGERILRIRSKHPSTKSTFHPILGLQVVADHAGRISTQGAYLRAGMLFSNDPALVGISIGFNVGFVNYNLRIEPDDDIQGLNLDKLSSMHPDVGIGVFAYREVGGFNFNGKDDYIYGGISIPQMFQNTINFGSEKLSYEKVRHLYLMGGYNKKLSDLNYAETNVWVKKVGSLGWVFDFNSRYIFNDRFIFGAGYSSVGTYSFESAFVMPLGNQKNSSNKSNRRLKIGIGYEVPTKYNSVFGNSFELNLSYSVPKDPRRRI